MNEALTKEADAAAESVGDLFALVEGGEAQEGKEVNEEVAKRDEWKKAEKEKMEEAGIVKIEMPDVDITYVGQTQRESLDSKALRAEEPEIDNKFIKKSDVKSSIRIKVK